MSDYVQAGAPYLTEEGLLARTGGRELKRVVFSAQDIERRVCEMAGEITRHYSPDDDVLILGLLKGSFIFLSDLVRHIDRRLHVDFIVASSYGAGTTSSGDVKLLYDPTAPIDGRHIVLVEDIVDTGLTLQYLLKNLSVRKPASLSLAALLIKDGVERPPLDIAYEGFHIPPKFVVGYGLDLDGKYRNLPYVAEVEGAD